MARWIDNALATPRPVRDRRRRQRRPGRAVARRPTGGFVTGRIHAGGTFAATGLRHELGWVVGGDEVADVSENEMEIWYGPQDRFDVEVRPPGRRLDRPGRARASSIRNEVLDNGTVLSVHNETYHPANGANRISIVLSPVLRPGATAASRSIGPIAARGVAGAPHRHRRARRPLRRLDRARRPAPASRARRAELALPVVLRARHLHRRPHDQLARLRGADPRRSRNVDVGRNTAHVTSSRGPTRDGRFKPDIGADGTDIVAARGFDRAQPWIEMTGTSMASPYVCGVAALMLGDRARPDLRADPGHHAHAPRAPLAGHDFGWRNDTGFGVIDAAACVEEAVAYEQASRRAAMKLKVFFAVRRRLPAAHLRATGTTC